jgi:hypothetical protein
MWKFLKNAMAGEILENKCLLISKQSEKKTERI